MVLKIAMLMVVVVLTVGCRPQTPPGETAPSAPPQTSETPTDEAAHSTPPQTSEEQAPETAATRASDGGSKVSDGVVSGSFTSAGASERARVHKVVLPDAKQAPDCRGGQYCAGLKCRADVILVGADGQDISTIEFERGMMDGEGGLEYEAVGTVPLGDSGKDALVIRRDSGYHDVAVMSLLIVRVDRGSTKILWQGRAEGQYTGDESRLPAMEVEVASPEQIVIKSRSLPDEITDEYQPLQTRRIILRYREDETLGEVLKS